MQSELGRFSQSAGCVLPLALTYFWLVHGHDMDERAHNDVRSGNDNNLNDLDRSDAIVSELAEEDLHELAIILNGITVRVEAQIQIEDEERRDVRRQAESDVEEDAADNSGLTDGVWCIEWADDIGGDLVACQTEATSRGRRVLGRRQTPS